MIEEMRPYRVNVRCIRISLQLREETNFHIEKSCRLQQNNAQTT